MPNPAGPMACPIDGTALVMSERSGIEIDYCPSCRGVWLDRGELDKIIERASRYVEVPLRDYDEDEDSARVRRNLPPRRSTYWRELFD